MTIEPSSSILTQILVAVQGQKRMPVATKVPAVKRSLEKFLFCVKGLLHSASNGSAFLLGSIPTLTLSFNTFMKHTLTVCLTVRDIEVSIVVRCLIYKCGNEVFPHVSAFCSHCVCLFSGNLKHKDLQGRVVASQIYREAGDEEEEEEDQEEEQQEEHDSDETVDEEVALGDED